MDGTNSKHKIEKKKEGKTTVKFIFKPCKNKSLIKVHNTE